MLLELLFVTPIAKAATHTSVLGQTILSRGGEILTQIIMKMI